MPLPNFSGLSLRACQPTGRPVIREGGGPNPAGLDGEEGAICNICLNPLAEMANNSDADDPEVKQREDAIWAALGWTNMCQQLETCGHQFHTQCLAEAAQSTGSHHNKCPTCRVPLDATELNWLQTVTVPPRPGQAPPLPTQPNWRDVSQRLHGESTRREPPGPRRTLGDDDYEVARRFIERKLRRNLDRSPVEILTQLLDVEQLDGPGFGLINSQSEERLRAYMRTIRGELQQQREAVVQSFLDDGTIFTLLLMQPETYFRGMGAMPGGGRPDDPRMRNPNFRLGERVGNMLAALYPREFEPWWEPQNDSGQRIGTPDVLRTRVAAAAENAYAELGRQKMRGATKRKTGESVKRRVLRLLPDLRRLWANGAAHESQPHIGPDQRRFDGYKVLADHMQLRNEVLNLYHLTLTPNIHAWYAHRDNVTMSIEHKEDASVEFRTELDTLAALVVQTAVPMPIMPLVEMRERENELLLPQLPDVDGVPRYTSDNREIDESTIRLLLGQAVAAEQVDERVYRSLPPGAKELAAIAAADAERPRARVRAARASNQDAAAAAARWRAAEAAAAVPPAPAMVRERSRTSEERDQPRAQRPREEGGGSVVDQVLQERRRIQPPIRDDSSDSEDLPGREDTLPPGQPRRRSSDSEADYWGAVADRSEEAAVRADRDVASEDESESDDLGPPPRITYLSGTSRRSAQQQDSADRLEVPDEHDEAFEGDRGDLDDAGPDVPAGPYSRMYLGPQESPSVGQWVFAHLLHQELASLEPPISIEPRNLVGAEGEPTEDGALTGPHLLAWTRARGRWELFGMMDARWGPLSEDHDQHLTRYAAWLLVPTRDGQWERVAFGSVNDNYQPSSWEDWNEFLQPATRAYEGTTLNWEPWVSNREERGRIAAFERAVMARLAGPRLGTISVDGRVIVSQDSYAAAVAAQRAFDREAAGPRPLPPLAPHRPDAGPDDPPGPYSRDAEPPNGWSVGHWVFARLLHQELAALDPPISMAVEHLVGSRPPSAPQSYGAPYVLAHARASERWNLFAVMDIQLGPRSTVVDTSLTRDGQWADAAFGFTYPDGGSAQWTAWNDRVAAAADAYVTSGGSARTAAFELAVMRRLSGALPEWPTGGRGTVSQRNYDLLVAAQRAEEREAAEADRAAQARADEAQEALRRPPQRQPSMDYTDRVRANAERRRA